MATVTGVLVTLAGFAWQVVTWIWPATAFPSFRPWMLWLPGLAFLFYGSFLAWKDEYCKRTELERLTQPSLRGMVQYVNVGPREGQPNELIVLLFLSVKNTGADSVAHGYRFAHITPSGQRTPAEMLQPREDVELVDGSRIRLADDLIPKTTEQPIPRGAQRVGFIVGRFFDTTVDNLLQTGSVYEVVCFDVFDRPHTFCTHIRQDEQLPQGRSVRYAGFESVIGYLQSRSSS